MSHLISGLHNYSINDNRSKNSLSAFFVLVVAKKDKIFKASDKTSKGTKKGNLLFMVNYQLSYNYQLSTRDRFGFGFGYSSLHLNT